MKYRTTAAYLSGAICGNIWWPSDALAGIPINQNCRGPWGFMDRFNEPVSFDDALLHVLMRDGGDFQNSQFTADTVIRIERKATIAPGKYSVHVKEIEVSKLAPHLVNQDAYTGDFLGD